MADLSVAHVAQMEELRYLQWLKDVCGYQHVTALPGGRWAATHQFMYTCAILVGRIGDRIGYDDRWCYERAVDAGTALDKWNGIGEPDGWHRHPGTGRRRNTDGDEWINP